MRYIAIYQKKEYLVRKTLPLVFLRRSWSFYISKKIQKGKTTGVSIME